MEMNFAIYLEAKGIPFREQVEFELQSSFVHPTLGKMLPMRLTADFELPNGFVLDTKGRESERFEMRKKMFAYKFPNKRLVLVKQNWGKWEFYEYSCIEKNRLTEKQVFEGC
jgi:hypothetical protein